MGALIHDLRYGLRALWKSPGFLAVSVALLGLGIGGTLTVFNLFNAILLKPLPGIANPDTLTMMGRTDRGLGFNNGSFPNYLDYRDQNTVFQGLAAYVPQVTSVLRGEESERVMSEIVTGNYFEVAGVGPSAGRLLHAADDQPGSDAVVISERLWERLFEKKLDVAGEKITLSGKPHTVAGVAGGGFHGAFLPVAIDVWIPFSAVDQRLPDGAPVAQARNASWVRMIGRLKPGIGVAQAQANLDAVSRNLAATYPETNRDTGVRVAEYHAFPSPAGKRNAAMFLAILNAVTVLVLLVVCANVSNLLLARASARRRDIAIRLAMGASRGRLVRQILGEGLVVAVAGAAAGLLVMLWGAEWLFLQLPRERGFAVTLDTAPDWRVFGFAAILAGLSSLAFGLLPALQASRPDLAPSLKAGESAIAPRTSRLRTSLSVVQVALCLVLVVTTGLLARSLSLLRGIDTGLHTDDLLLVAMDPSLAGYDEARGKQFYRQLLDRVRQLPGVQAASLAVAVPYGGGGLGLGPVSGGAVPEQERFPADANVVAGDFFRTTGARLLRGREFEQQDAASPQRVAIVNQTLAERLWPGDDPLGGYFKMAGHTYQVIGLAADQRDPVRDLKRPFVYTFYEQVYMPEQTLHVHSAAATALAESVRQSARELAPAVPIYDVRTMRTQVESALWTERVAATLASYSSLLALLMATLGLYAVLAYNVAQRTREIGVRMALGAKPSSVLRTVLRSGMKLAVLGIVVGVGLAALATRALASMLHGIGPDDPLSFVGAVIVLLLTTLAACYVPARRATRVDPLVALRNE